MNIDQVYKQLTDVDIEQQKQIWDERGKGYYGEYLLFCHLHNCLWGNSKILMNLDIPVTESKTTEVDLLLIHETGLYVFEIKHYKGTIYGKDTDAVWTQYFRTAKNNTFKNPIEQNAYHIKALQGLFPNMPIHSCIVFTSAECDIKVNNNNPKVDVCCLNAVSNILEYRFNNNPVRYSMEEIDETFSKLSVFSKMRKQIIIDGVAADFLSWVKPTVAKLEESRKATEDARKQWAETTKKSLKIRKITLVCGCVFAVLCVIFSILISSAIISENNKELEQLRQSLLSVEEADKDVDDLKTYINVLDVKLLPQSKDAVSFSASLTVKENAKCGIVFTETAEYIVETSSGQVFRYNVFGEHLAYSRSANMLAEGIRTYGELATIQFKGISDINEITNVKIKGVELFKAKSPENIVGEDLEIELYVK